MLLQLIIGTLVISVTVAFQAVAFDFIIRKTHWLQQTSLRKHKELWQAVVTAIVVLAVSCTLIVEIWIWGLLYLGLGAMDHLETALYFSTSSFTTVGYGDVVLTHEWRMLSAVESLNGFLLFGWGTAFIFEVVSRVYRKEGKAIET